MFSKPEMFVPNTSFLHYGKRDSNEKCSQKIYHQRFHSGPDMTCDIGQCLNFVENTAYDASVSYRNTLFLLTLKMNLG